MKTLREIERLALNAHIQGESWPAFWPTIAQHVGALEPHCRERHRRLVGRLMHLMLTGDYAGHEPIDSDSPTPSTVVDPPAEPPADTGTTARYRGPLPIPTWTPEALPGRGVSA